MKDEILSSIKEINSFGENLLESSLQRISSQTPLLNSDGQLIQPNNLSAEVKKPRRGGGCPFQINTSNDPLTTKFQPHYALNIWYHPYDFLFDKLNYPSQDWINNSKEIRGYPRHLRNTWFLNNEKIKKVRNMDFSSIYVISEELKEKANELYNQNKYFDALIQYNIIYALYIWIEFKAKDKQTWFDNNLWSVTKSPIWDSDIKIRKTKVSTQYQYDEENYNNTILFILKAMSYCYINIRSYSEAIKCLNEAMDFSKNNLPDVYFRRAQARLYNKYSTWSELFLAKQDLKEARKRKKGEKVIEDAFVELEKIIKNKESKNLLNIKKWLHNFRYAYTMILKKSMDVNQIIIANYEMTDLNYKIWNDVKETYYYTLRHYYKNKNYVEFNKGVNEFDAFWDHYYEYDFYYQLSPWQIPVVLYNNLVQEEKEDWEWIKVNKNCQKIFNDFKFKKCDELFMGIEFNSQIYEKCYENVLDNQRFIEEGSDTTGKLGLFDFAKVIDKKAKTELSYKSLVIYYIQKGLLGLKNMLKMSNAQFYVFSVLIFIFSLIVIIIPFISR